jgi:hypothetical protein
VREVRNDAICWNIFCSRKRTFAFLAEYAPLFSAADEASSSACFVVCGQRSGCATPAVRYEFPVDEGANHMFQTCETGSPEEYGRIEETFSPKVLHLMGDWILNRVAKPR